MSAISTHQVDFDGDYLENRKTHECNIDLKSWSILYAESQLWTSSQNHYNPLQENKPETAAPWAKPDLEDLGVHPS